VVPDLRRSAPSVLGGLEKILDGAMVERGPSPHLRPHTRTGAQLPHPRHRGGAGLKLAP